MCLFLPLIIYNSSKAADDLKASLCKKLTEVNWQNIIF